MDSRAKSPKNQSVSLHLLQESTALGLDLELDRPLQPRHRFNHPIAILSLHRLPAHQDDQLDLDLDRDRAPQGQRTVSAPQEYLDIGPLLYSPVCYSAFIAVLKPSQFQELSEAEVQVAVGP